MADHVMTRLGQVQPGVAAGTIYTAPAGRSAMVREVVVCNVTGGSVSLSLSFCVSGATPGDVNRVLKNAPIEPNATVIFTFMQVLPTGGFVSAMASAAASLTVTVSGVERI